MVEARSTKQTRPARTATAGKTTKRRSITRTARAAAPRASIQTASTGQLTVKAYRGDAKTLLAFNLPKAAVTDLAGFTIQCRPGDQPAYYLHNMLRFETPEGHAQEDKESPNSSINAPIHKFRWIHVPGSIHQGTRPFFGLYTYTVTPRYFENGALRPLDQALSASLVIEVSPFQTAGLEVGFTRGFTQSQAFVNHFGKDAVIQPKDHDLLFDTSKIAGTNAAGDKFTYADEYEWLGFTARAKLTALLDEVVADSSLHLDMFAYDLNEPDVMAALLKLARRGQIRMILDNASLHHDAKAPKPEDRFEQAFLAAAKKGATILRGKFGRYSHDKVLIISRNGKPQKVLTGSTNFSVTGLYVNSNHVLVFNDPVVAARYAEVFEVAWNGKARAKPFTDSPLASQTGSFSSSATPRTEITFSPHAPAFATAVLQGLVSRVEREATRPAGSVLFAVMQLDKGSGPVFPALRELHADQKVFSYGISDTPGGIRLYTPGSRTGVLVTGRPIGTKLPPPFSQVPAVAGHQIHHKFVVCGFNGDDPVVYCGSSNLAEGGEQENGDNLLAIHDRGVATVFAIEALGLVDHFNFLDRTATGAKRTRTPKPAKPAKPAASKRQAAVEAGWFLSTTDRWTAPYFDAADLHFADRVLFG
jgi:phosphatidylserine/phosphatidylglycerophosphate/cardiolipin synthase-like enzyme